jgi:hypothetical protein
MLSTHEHGEQEAAHHGSSDGTGKRDRKGRRVGGGGGGGEREREKGRELA